MIQILFVCHGNICRSPMAEFILPALARARGLEGCYQTASAAVSSEETGNPMYPPARRCLNQHGVPFDAGKRARKVVPADYDRNPWYTGDFEQTFQDLLTACGAMLDADLS